MSKSVVLDATHDPATQSWVTSANAPDCDFPIQNLPFGRFRRSPAEPWQIGVADREFDGVAHEVHRAVAHRDVDAAGMAAPRRHPLIPPGDVGPARQIILGPVDALMDQVGFVRQFGGVWVVI